MKWYLIRNRSHDHLTAHDLMGSAARGKYKLKGFGGLNTQQDERDAYMEIAVFPPHSERAITILGSRDKGKGIVCAGGLWQGLRGSFLIKEVDSPRHIWTEKTEPEIPLMDDK